MGLFGYSSKKEENVMPDFKKEEKVLIDKTKPLPELPVHTENIDHRDDFHENNLTKPSSNKEFEIINKILILWKKF